MSGGDTIAADDISGVKYQRIKLIHGADGTNDGDVSTANGLPINIVIGLAGEDINNDVIKTEKRGTPFNISTATTTTVATGVGHLNNLICVGGTLGNVTVYNNTTAAGTPILAAVTPVAGGVLLQDIDFTVGLTIVTAAATVLSGSCR